MNRNAEHRDKAGYVRLTHQGNTNWQFDAYDWFPNGQLATNIRVEEAQIMLLSNWATTLFPTN